MNNTKRYKDNWQEFRTPRFDVKTSFDKLEHELEETYDEEMKEHRKKTKMKLF